MNAGTRELLDECDEMKAPQLLYHSLATGNVEQEGLTSPREKRWGKHQGGAEAGILKNIKERIN